MNVQHKSQLIIIQTTSFCNIDCSYCYLSNRSEKKRINDKTIRQIGHRLAESEQLGSDLTFVWHAGEPMTVEPEAYQIFFRSLRELIPASTRISHSFQTNGTLVTERWRDFFCENHVSVGFSIDGPKHVHDAYRKTRAGYGTFDQAIRGYRLLRDSGLNPGIISVVTDRMLDAADDFCQFLLDEKVCWLGLNVEEIEGANRVSSMLALENAERWKVFVKRLYRVSRDHGVKIRELDGALTAIKNQGRVCDDESRPFSIVSFSSSGDFSTFSPELLDMTFDSRNFIYGNVFSESLASAQGSQKFRDDSLAVEMGVAECRRSCDYYGFCGGGAPVNKIVENGSFKSTETLHCIFKRKLLVDSVLDELELGIS